MVFPTRLCYIYDLQRMPNNCKSIALQKFRNISARVKSKYLNRLQKYTQSNFYGMALAHLVTSQNKYVTVVHCVTITTLHYRFAHNRTIKARATFPATNPTYDLKLRTPGGFSITSLCKSLRNGQASQCRHCRA